LVGANLERVREAYFGLGRGELSALFDLLSEEVEWVVHLPAEAGPGGAYRGRAGVAEWARRAAEAAEVEAFGPEEFIVTGERVLVLGRERLRVRPTGRRGEFGWGHVLPLAGGAVGRAGRVCGRDGRVALLWAGGGTGGNRGPKWIGVRTFSGPLMSFRRSRWGSSPGCWRRWGPSRPFRPPGGRCLRVWGWGPGPGSLMPAAGPGGPCPT